MASKEFEAPTMPNPYFMKYLNFFFKVISIFFFKAEVMIPGDGGHVPLNCLGGGIVPPENKKILTKDWNTLLGFGGQRLDK